MRKIILYELLVMIVCSCANSQPNNKNNKGLTENFTGKVEYIDDYEKIIFSTDSCGSVLLSQIWEFKNGYFSVESFDPIDSVKYKSTPIKFNRINNSIYIYFSAKDNQIDSSEQFKISATDTLYSYDDFKTFSSQTEKDIESIYTGDTILTIQDINYHCYRFELFKYWMKTFPGPSHLKKIIYIDKKTLIPVQEDQYLYFARHFCFPKYEWFLSRQVKLEKIY